MADVRFGDAVTTRGPLRRFILVFSVELVVIIAALTTALVLALTSSVKAGPLRFLTSEHHSDAADRANAVSVARQFTLNSDAFNPADLPGYLNSVKPLMTTKAQQDLASQYQQFDDQAGQVLQQLAKDNPTTTLKATGSVQFAALATYEPDLATVLVAHDVTYPQTPAQTYRWVVTLRKIDGRWLVDSFDPNPTLAKPAQ